MIKALMLKYETTTDSGINNPMRGKEPLEIILNAAETYNPDILLAPEFFFYNGGKPYSRKEKKEIEKEIAGTAGKEGRLIIPGTIIWEGFWGIYNTAPIIDGTNISEYHKATDGGTSQIAIRDRLRIKYGKESGRLFKWRNLDLGIEICSDHAEGSIRKLRRKADIHIIAGCGMRVHDNKAIARERGYLLLCDGAYHERELTSNKAMKNENGILQSIKPSLKTTTEELYELEL
ncbi:MAG: hypothetical protein WC852_01645 [Candidatus Nanoarchaeia archaeon]|jgi:predicted amidohydrolase